MSHAIIALEEKMAFLERTVTDLDDVIRSIQTRLDHLTDVVEQMQKSDVGEEGEVEEDRFA